MLHTICLRTGLACHRFGGASLEGCFIQETQVPEVPGRVQPERAFLSPRESAYAPAEGLLRGYMPPQDRVFHPTEQEAAAQGSQELAQRRTTATKYKKYDQNNFTNL